MSELVASDVTVVRGTKRLVDNASLTLPKGTLTVLLGPNGAGKTSLIKVLAGLEKPSTGQVSIDLEPMARMSATRRARQIAYLPQARVLAWPIRVRDVVALGRFAYGVSPARMAADDAAAVTRALSACDLVRLAERRSDSLSGGELARVHCARALAAEAPLLIADEPTAALDPRHAFEIIALVHQFVQSGASALLVLHDIALAARYADRLVWMQDGRIVSQGSVADTLTPQRLAAVFGVQARVSGREVTLEGPLSGSG